MIGVSVEYLNGYIKLCVPHYSKVMEPAVIKLQKKVFHGIHAKIKIVTTITYIYKYTSNISLIAWMKSNGVSVDYLNAYIKLCVPHSSKVMEPSVINLKKNYFIIFIFNVHAKI